MILNFLTDGDRRGKFFSIGERKKSMTVNELPVVFKENQQGFPRNESLHAKFYCMIFSHVISFCSSVDQ